MVRERAVRQIGRVVQTVAKPIQEFLKLQSASGILLVASAAAALVWSNSPWSSSYDQWWHTTISFKFGSAEISRSLHHWINDGLMTVFFFVVGLEIKREMLIGELSSVKKALLPVVAAVGGMAVPAIIYAVFNRGTAAESGWGIPMATDIAFSLGVLTLLGKRIPIQLKVFLTAFAIVDDIGAVIVIALFYASGVVWSHLAVAGVILMLLMGANRLGVRHPLLYVVLGVLVWLAFLGSGIHSTVAGVLLAMTIPARSTIDQRGFLERSHGILEQLRRETVESEHPGSEAQRQASVRTLGQLCEDVEAPIQRFEHALSPWVLFVIMPVFALANAGVRFEQGIASLLLHPVALGVFLGLAVGKPIGITLFAWISVKFGIASLPSAVTWRQIAGVGWLGGIGFTMSIFITGLAFGIGPLADVSKVAIYAASVIVGIGGTLVLLSRSRVRPQPSS